MQHGLQQNFLHQNGVARWCTHQESNLYHRSKTTCLVVEETPPLNSFSLAQTDLALQIKGRNAQIEGRNAQTTDSLKNDA